MNFPSTTSTRFVLTINDREITDIVSSNLHYEIYRDTLCKSILPFSIFTRLEGIKPLMNYYTDFECDEKFALKSDISTDEYVKIKGDSTIMGTLAINAQKVPALEILTSEVSTTGMPEVLGIYRSDIRSGHSIHMYIGKQNRFDESVYYGYKDPGIGVIGVTNADDIITFNKESASIIEYQRELHTFIINDDYSEHV